MDSKLHLLLLPIAGALLLSQCTTAPSGVVSSPPPPAAARYSGESDVAKRPGLGTQPGHELHYSPSHSTHFYRKALSAPDAVATFYYNDEEGARLMAQMSGHAVKRKGAFDLVPGKLRASLAPSYGDAFPHYLAGGKVFVIGTAGADYRIRLENLTNTAIEVVVSIDGLDVVDGRPASVRKRGYVIPARSTVAIAGMRAGGKYKSLRFGSVAQSRAATAFGEAGARNVGVIGAAIYEEDEAARRRARVGETYVREDARAFGR